MEHEEVDILDIDDEMEDYDFEQRDVALVKADHAETGVETDIVASLAAKIEMMERSRESLPDWAVSVQGVSKLLTDFDWDILR